MRLVVFDWAVPGVLGLRGVGEGDRSSEPRGLVGLGVACSLFGVRC